MHGATNTAMVLNTLGAGGVTEVACQLLKRLPASGGARRLYVLKKPVEDADGKLDRVQALAADGITATFGAGHKGKIASIAHLATWLEKERIALLHTHSYRPNLYGRIAGVLRRGDGLRLVAHYHNQYDDKWREGSEALLLERQLAGQTDAMVAVSAAVRDHVAQALGRDPAAISVVENGVDVDRLAGGRRDVVRREFGLADDDMVVGLVGRICEQKGQDDLVATARLISSRHPRLRYLIVGDEEDKDLCRRLRREIASAGLDRIIHFTGFRCDMANIYAAIDILAAPSRWEGFGLMLVEAMAAGVPIVASNVGAIADVLDGGESGLLVAPRDPARLGEAIARLASEPRLRETLAATGRRCARRYSWDGAARQIADMHEALLSSPRPGSSISAGTS